jgi:hypothetical protein
VDSWISDCYDFAMGLTKNLAREFAKRAAHARSKARKQVVAAKSERLALRSGLYQRFAARLHEAAGRTWTKE